MVIYVRGTEKSRNSAYSLTALLAGEGAIKYNKRQLILPFDTDRDIEQYFLGKDIEDEDLRNAIILEGLDSLFIAAESQRLLSEQFSQYCKAIFPDSRENLLDIPKKTEKVDIFIDELLKKPELVEDLVRFAREIYDEIYLISKGNNEELIKLLNNSADMSLICVRQVQKENIIAPHENSVFVVNEYDKNSTYNLKRIANEYNTRKAIAMPYCVEFKDAYNDGKLSYYIGRNQNINKYDVNYPLFSECDKLLEKIHDVDTNIEMDKPEPVEELEESVIEDEEITDLPEEYEAEPEIVEGKKYDHIEMNPPTFKKKNRRAVEEIDVDEVTYEEDEVTYEEDEISTDDEVVITPPKKRFSLFGRKKKKEVAESFEGMEEYVGSSDDKNEQEEELIQEKPIERKKRRRNKKAVVPEEEVEVDIPEDDSEKPRKSRRRKNKNTAEVEPVPEEVEVEENIQPAPKKKRRKKADSEIESSAPAPKSAKPQKSDGTWKCPECGTINKNKFCNECGHERPEPKPAVKTGPWKCKTCGALNPSDSKFCNECGQKR